MPEGKWEILVHFGSFKNIDLFRQGLYYFRASVYTKFNVTNPETKKVETKKQYELAYIHFDDPTKRRKGQTNGLLKPEEVKKHPAGITNGGAVFNTRCLRVQYQEQVTRMNESCLFRMVMPFKGSKVVYIDIDLVFAERHSDDYKKKGIVGLGDNFKVVETTTLVVQELKTIHAMHPVTFSDQFFCLLNIQIHIELLSLEASFRTPEDPVGSAPASINKILPKEREFKIPTDDELETLQTHYGYYLKMLLRSYREIRKILNDRAALDIVDRARILKQIGITKFPIPDLSPPGGWKDDDKKIFKPFKDVYQEEKENDLPLNKLTNSVILYKMTRKMDLISSQTFEIWNALVRCVPFLKKAVMRKYFEEYQEEFCERAGAVIFRETKSIGDRNVPPKRTDEEHEKISEIVRTQQQAISNLPPPKVQNIIHSVPPKLQAVIFEETFNKRKPKEKPDPTKAFVPLPSIQVSSPKKGVHLFVLVHGYQGSSWDMRLFKNHLQAVLDHSDCDPMFLCSKMNEQKKTEGDIRQMGRRLAKEVAAYIDKHVPKVPRRREGGLQRISFITHSLGGIITRAALVEPAMKPYTKFCWTFLSLAVCHGGHLFGSTIVRGGLALLKRWNKSASLTQLSLGDDNDPRKTFMYYLSTQPGFQHFKHVLLISSPADKYSPYHSARAELVWPTNPLHEVYNEICQNILKPLNDVYLTRFDVSFVKKQDFWNNAIGRSAHIFFLDQPAYVDMLVNVYKQFFV